MFFSTLVCFVQKEVRGTSVSITLVLLESDIVIIEELNFEDEKEHTP